VVELVVVWLFQRCRSCYAFEPNKRHADNDQVGTAQNQEQADTLHVSVYMYPRLKSGQSFDSKALRPHKNVLFRALQNGAKHTVMVVRHGSSHDCIPSMMGSAVSSCVTIFCVQRICGIMMLRHSSIGQ
jgi:hypothetical protein